MLYYLFIRVVVDPLLVFVYMIPVSTYIHTYMGSSKYVLILYYIMESMSDMNVLSCVLHLLVITITLHMYVYEIL